MYYWLIGDNYSGRFLELVVRAKSEQVVLEIATQWFNDPNADLEAVRADFIDAEQYIIKGGWSKSPSPVEEE